MSDLPYRAGTVSAGASIGLVNTSLLLQMSGELRQSASLFIEDRIAGQVSAAYASMITLSMPSLGRVEGFRVENSIALRIRYVHYQTIDRGAPKHEKEVGHGAGNEGKD
jgi:hypothetical protein